MKQKLFFLPAIFAALLISVGADIFGQVPKPDFNRKRTINVEKYTIRTSFERSRKRVTAETTVDFRPLNDNFRTLELDAVGLQFESVSTAAGSASLPFRLTPTTVVVELDRAYDRGELASIRFKYQTIPAKGVYFVPARRGGRDFPRDAQIWSQGEPEEARHWIPSYDFPDDKAVSEQFITVDEDETAIANGELIDVASGGKSKTYHYRMEVPHSTYLISFVVGRYVRLSDQYRNVSLGFYTYPDQKRLADEAFAPIKDMMRTFEDLTAMDYPFSKYDQAIVGNFTFGGMENITATTLSDDDVFLISQPWGKNIVEDLVSHELAHSWFGNLVTCRNWAELWLNESFATFMEAAYRERRYGRSDYLRKIRTNADEYFAENARFKKKRGLFNQLAKPDDSIFDAVTYQKGSAVIHTLRVQLGDEVFWKAVRTYLQRFKGKNVETTDLKAVFEEISGKDLTEFFEQWVYGARHPIIRYTRNFDRTTGNLRLEFEQTQIADEYSPQPFRFNLDIELMSHGGRRTETVRIEKRIQSVEIKTDRQPDKLNFDPESKIPLLQIKKR